MDLAIKEKTREENTKEIENRITIELWSLSGFSVPLSDSRLPGVGHPLRALVVPLASLDGSIILTTLHWNVDVLITIFVALCTNNCERSWEDKEGEKAGDSEGDYPPVGTLCFFVRVEELVPFLLEE